MSGWSTDLRATLPARPRIAFVRRGRLGDLVVATPALRALRHALPQAHIALLADPVARHLEGRLPAVDEIIIVPERSGRPELYDVDPELRVFLADMRARRFDVALQATGGGETMNYFVQALGAGLTAGQRYEDAPELDLSMPFHRPLQPEPARLMDVVGLIGVPPGSLKPEVCVLPRDVEDLATIIDPDSLAHTVGVHLGSGSGSRRWAPERVAAVLDVLLTEVDSLQAVLLAAAPDEIPLGDVVLRHMTQAHRVRNLCGRVPFGPFLALLQRLYLLLGNDSAPAHLASALDVPAVIVYGSGHPCSWSPVSHLLQRPVAALDAPCRAVGQRCGCPDTSQATCLLQVTPRMVLTEIASLRRFLARRDVLQAVS